MEEACRHVARVAQALPREASELEVDAVLHDEPEQRRTVHARARTACAAQRASTTRRYRRTGTLSFLHSHHIPLDEKIVMPFVFQHLATAVNCFSFHQSFDLERSPFYIVDPNNVALQLVFVQ